jgi:uncharacterized membrane protein YhaH (DUF805 family)
MNTDSSNAAAVGVVGVVLLVEFLFILAIVAFTIWIYWRIFAKAGFNGALSLLNLVPGVGSLICMCILGFGRWPIEDRLAALEDGHSYVPPSSAPGTTVATQ